MPVQCPFPHDPLTCFHALPFYSQSLICKGIISCDFSTAPFLRVKGHSANNPDCKCNHGLYRLIANPQCPVRSQSVGKPLPMAPAAKQLLKQVKDIRSHIPAPYTARGRLQRGEELVDVSIALNSPRTPTALETPAAFVEMKKVCAERRSLPSEHFDFKKMVKEYQSVRRTQLKAAGEALLLQHGHKRSSCQKVPCSMFRVAPHTKSVTY